MHERLPSHTHTFSNTHAQVQTPKERDITGDPHLLGSRALSYALGFQEPALQPWTFLCLL